MNKTITVNVTEEHIKKGVVSHPKYCPIALATKKLGIVEVGREKVVIQKKRWFRKDVRIYVELPKSAQEFICNFDNMVDVAPISFEIKIPK